MYKGLSIKDVGEGGEGVQHRQFADRGESSDADDALFCAKKLWIFRNLWCVRRQRGGGQVFAILCGRILRTASNRKFFVKRKCNVEMYFQRVNVSLRIESYGS